MDNKLQNMVTIKQFVSSPFSYEPNKTVIDNGNNLMLPLITQSAYRLSHPYSDKILLSVRIRQHSSYMDSPVDCT